MTPRRLRWAVVGLVVLALLGTVVSFHLRRHIAHTEVWRTETGTELRSGPGGDVLDEYVDLVCSDPSGKRVDYVARRRSPLDVLPDWPGREGRAVIHRLDETETVVEARGKRWRRCLVRQEGLTPEEVEDDIQKGPASGDRRQ